MQSSEIMLYLVEVELEKNVGTKNNCGRWSDTLNEIFPEIAVLIYGFGILQNIMSVRVEESGVAFNQKLDHQEKYLYIQMYRNLIGHY